MATAVQIDQCDRPDALRARGARWPLHDGHVAPTPMRSVRQVVAVGCTLLLTVVVVGAQAPEPPPPGFIRPPLNPSGTHLRTERLADGVYALLADRGFVDNAGFIVGRDAVLVVDAHFSVEMARQILAAVRRVTDRPIRYLLNTNGAADHVFGNAEFPAETRIIAHRRVIEALRATTVDQLRTQMLPTVGHDPTVFEGVRLRLPDESFDEIWRTDLGGIVVEARYFGDGMTPGDTIVSVPSAGVAWTGNLVFGAGTIPWAANGNVRGYRDTLDRARTAIRATTLVPGHGALAHGGHLALQAAYLTEVLALAADAKARGLTAPSWLAEATVPSAYPIATPLTALMTGFHRWNLQRAWKETP